LFPEYNNIIGKHYQILISDKNRVNEGGMLSKAKRGDLRFIADKLFIALQFKLSFFYA
jgi:hypothetical protein